MSTKTTIVVVEDDQLAARILSYQLRAAGYHCQVFHSATEFIAAAPLLQAAELFVLDYDLGPNEPSGLELCRKITGYFHKPVIMLTGNSSVDTLVSCLSAGADQYICKPWDSREVMARIAVALRKSAGRPDSSDINPTLRLILDNTMTLDWDGQQLRHHNGRYVDMTHKELAIMELFVADEQHYVDREHAFRVLYGYDMPPANRSVDVLVSRIRKKLTELDTDYRIKTMRGKGYQLSRVSRT